VPPQIFIQVLRPYFEAIIIDGHEHRGPGAVEMPLFLVDHILWSSRIVDPPYVAFKERYVSSLLPYLRAHYASYQGQASLLDRVEEELDSGGDRTSTALHDNLSVLDEIFKVLVRFRAPHLGMAYQAYSKREGSAYNHGSGGFTPPTLAMILDHTRTAHARVLAMMTPRFQGAEASGVNLMPGLEESGEHGRSVG
jgi:hypothetical protein